MNTTPADALANLNSPDPLVRFRAAEAARDYCNGAAQAALQDLLAAHRGNASAVARELGVTPQAVSKRLAATDKPAGRAVRQEQPALRFTNAEEGIDALHDWALRQQDVLDQRDQLILGALAAGVPAETVYRITGLPADAVNRLQPADAITVAAELPEPLLEDAARQLLGYAHARESAAATAAERAAGRLLRLGAEGFHHNCAPYALIGPGPASLEEWEAQHDAETGDDAQTDEDLPEQDDLAVLGGADAWLATRIITYRRERQRCLTAADRPADALNDPDVNRAMATAFGLLADHHLHLRTHGTLPPLPGDPS